MKLPVYSSGTGRESVYPGAVMTKEQARKFGEKNMPKDLRRVGFKTHVFESDIEIHGEKYLRITYGKDC